MVLPTGIAYYRNRRGTGGRARVAPGVYEEMNAPRTTQRPTSERAEKHAAMLETALACPGIRHVVKIFGIWQEEDQRLDAARAARAAIGRGRTVTTGRSFRTLA